MIVHPPWEYHWTRGATVVQQINKRDTVERLPSGEYIAVLANGEFIHGPFDTVEEAVPCTKLCDCWKPEVKQRQAERRQALHKEVNEN